MMGLATSPNSVKVWGPVTPGQSRVERRASATLRGTVEPAVPPQSEAGRILTESLTWTAEEWLTLSPERRQYLFAHAARTPGAAEKVEPLALAIADALIAERRGAEVQSWIAYATTSGVQARGAVWSGERGARLLSLDPESGFNERAVIALHRGVHALSAGQLADSLRALAHALRWADESREAEVTRTLARRWLSFVASQFRVTDALFAMLQSVVPRGDYAAVLEDQLWHAALNADAESFERCLAHQVGRGALKQRAEVLRPLARGDAGAFATGLANGLAQNPYFAVRFLSRLVERLQAQDAGVRAAHAPMLRQLKGALEAAMAADETQRSQRRLQSLVDEIRALLEGLDDTAEGASDADKAHALSPDRELFVGSVRVAPSDPLPWPFRVEEARAPSVFSPLSLTPEEWPRGDGTLIFGWRVGEP